MLKLNWINIINELYKLFPLFNEKLKYRISCRRSGNKTNNYDIQEFNYPISNLISYLYPNWIVNLDNYDIELFVHINDDYIIVGIPLSKHTLSLRDNHQGKSMRTTIAYAMLMSADIQPNSIICDPFCGEGTILLELSTNYNSSIIIGCDNNINQINKCNELCKSFNNIQLIYTQSQSLPFHNNSIDYIISDIPFGRKYNDIKTVINIYPLFLKEAERCIKQNSFIILLSPHIKYIKECISKIPNLLYLSENYVKLGLLSAYIIKIQKRKINF